jgi:hypothetical protein
VFSRVWKKRTAQGKEEGNLAPLSSNPGIILTYTTAAMQGNGQVTIFFYSASTFPFFFQGLEKLF